MDNASRPSSAQEARFEQLMRDYETEVLRLCFLYLMDRSLAEDAMQDNFTKVWRHLERFERRNDCSIKTWTCALPSIPVRIICAQAGLSAESRHARWRKFTRH